MSLGIREAKPTQQTLDSLYTWQFWLEIPVSRSQPEYLAFAPFVSPTLEALAAAHSASHVVPYVRCPA